MDRLSPRRRLRDLERTWPTPVCPTCHGHPYRLVTLDPETVAVIAETLPATGCPTCGRPIQHEVRIVGVDVHEL